MPRKPLVIDKLDMSQPVTLDRARTYVFLYGSHFDDCPGRPCVCGFERVWNHMGLPHTIGALVEFTKRVKARETPAPLGSGPLEPEG